MANANLQEDTAITLKAVCMVQRNWLEISYLITLRIFHGHSIVFVAAV